MEEQQVEEQQQQQQQEEEEEEEEELGTIPEIVVYPLRSAPGRLQVAVRQLPARGLSFQIWPAASALCWFLEDLFGETGMYIPHLPRLDQCRNLAFKAQISAERSDLPCSSSSAGGKGKEETNHTEEASRNGETEVCADPYLEMLASDETQVDETRLVCADSYLEMLASDGHERDGSWASLMNSEGKTQMRVLELGAGTGMVGILAAVLGADATITDLPHVIPNLLHNACLNQEAVKVSGRGGKISVKTLRWGEQVDMEALGRSFDLILASDVVYYDHLFEPLLQTLKWLLLEDEKKSSSLPHGDGNAESQSSSGPFVLLAHLRRWKKDAYFFRKASKFFDVRVVHRHSHHANSRTGVTVYCFALKTCN